MKFLPAALLNRIFFASLGCVALAGLISLVVTINFCVSRGITSRDAFHRYWLMSKCDSPIMKDLDRRKFGPGTPIEDLCSVHPPDWSESYGRIVYWHFAPPQSYDSLAVTAVDGKITEASAGSCTWYWTFFNETPQWMDVSVSSIRGYERQLTLFPQFRDQFQKVIDLEKSRLQPWNETSGTSQSFSEPPSNE